MDIQLLPDYIVYCGWATLDCGFWSTSEVFENIRVMPDCHSSSYCCVGMTSQIKDKVIFTGWKPREDLLSLMAESDVFLFPSLRDGGGAVVVEAMSMRIPVICLDISGPAMHVTDDSGIKVPAYSPEDSILGLASGLVELYLDEQVVSLCSFRFAHRETFFVLL